MSNFRNILFWQQVRRFLFNEFSMKALIFISTDYDFSIPVAIGVHSHIFSSILGMFETSLVVQVLRLRASTIGGAGSNPGRGSSTCRPVWCGQKKKRNVY